MLTILKEKKMKKTTSREMMFSALAGVLLALFVAFSSAGLTQKVSATGDEDYCVPPEGCGTFGCFTRTDGAKSCKNYSFDGGTCTGGACRTKPKGDIGIGIEDGPVN